MAKREYNQSRFIKTQYRKYAASVGDNKMSLKAWLRSQEGLALVVEIRGPWFENKKR